jgi:glycosyltransferase involved in cell wall biosynthesis
MRIAMLGTRGVPASYSGFETCVEELGARLAARGHDVTVYCRVPHITYNGTAYRGMRLVKLPTIRSKQLDTMAHSLLSAVHALWQGYDVALCFNVGISAVTWIPRLAGQRVVLNVDGLDWKRKKWGRVARWYIRTSERWATRFPHRVITDSRRVQEYYRARYGAPTNYIAYGAEPMTVAPGRYLAQYGLTPGRYVLFVGRLVPENCAHHLVEAFQALATDFRCVIIGDAPYAAAYIRELRATSDPRVVFTGYLFGEGYRELASNAYCFVETSEVGGTHPALLDTAATGSAMFTIREYDQTQNLYIPASYKKITLFAPLPRRFYCHIRSKPENTIHKEVASFDITVLDESGLRLVEIEEFVIRRIVDTAILSDMQVRSGQETNRAVRSSRPRHRPSRSAPEESGGPHRT